jgi:hypothetical protein
MDALARAGEGDLRASSPQQVDWRDSFNFLKTIREDCEYRRHAMI